MNFEIEYDAQPRKFLKRLDRHDIRRIMDKIDDTLVANPIPHNAKRVIGYNIPTFRIRVGKWRVLYRINYEDKKIIIVKIDLREKVY